MTGNVCTGNTQGEKKPKSSRSRISGRRFSTMYLNLLLFLVLISALIFSLVTSKVQSFSISNCCTLNPVINMRLEHGDLFCIGL